MVGFQIPIVYKKDIIHLYYKLRLDLLSHSMLIVTQIYYIQSITFSK